VLKGIVVTAQTREGSLQDGGIALTALGEQRLIDEHRGERGPHARVKASNRFR